MRRSFNVIFVFLLIVSNANGQNFVGLHKDEIIQLMKETKPNFKLNKRVVNKSYNYLKYENLISEQTLLFFLSDTDYCTLVRWISDYSNLNEIIELLNKNYKKEGENNWIYHHNSKDYIVKLEEEEWFFTVSFKSKE